MLFVLLEGLPASEFLRVLLQLDDEVDDGVEEEILLLTVVFVAGALWFSDCDWGFCEPSFLKMFINDDGFLMKPIKSLVDGESFVIAGIVLLDVLRLILFFCCCGWSSIASFSMLWFMLRIVWIEYDLESGLISLRWFTTTVCGAHPLCELADVVLLLMLFRVLLCSLAFSDDDEEDAGDDGNIGFWLAVGCRADLLLCCCGFAATILL